METHCSARPTSPQPLGKRLAACFRNHRSRRCSEHAVPQLVGQHLFALACEQRDILGERRRESDRGVPLAGRSTLNGLRTAAPRPAMATATTAMADLLADLFVESFAEPPVRIVLDVDATDDPLHGRLVRETAAEAGMARWLCALNRAPALISCDKQDGSSATICMAVMRWRRLPSAS